MTEDLRIVVGAGAVCNNPGWIHTQEEELSLLNREQWAPRFKEGSITAILAEHVWEHLTYDEGVQAARLCYDYLKPGGYIRCAVPDGWFPNDDYQRTVQVGGPGPKEHPAASHKIVHTCRSLQSLFASAGFEVELLEYCDESGRFHARDWDETKGFIYRTRRFDHRNRDGALRFVSLLVDAVKPESPAGRSSPQR
ncbi:class I SAM-dependent methyltransferase [Paenibacillus caseinilyticus]|uniref:SAM-dependent methyltransferase n=1 Tax=Paenibacillus mucilaginosus K02 TaxID=997761 RepID=I0BH71_9BACL|nr:SAM-dependent methyltransferase [Paenibacillus mucilaginosus]AFH61718.1 hypothetical protein B2K_13480 [Paenibacillus mucilaginosus K02]